MLSLDLTNFPARNVLCCLSSRNLGQLPSIAEIPGNPESVPVLVRFQGMKLDERIGGRKRFMKRLVVWFADWQDWRTTRW
jgi:hypothetical protein